MSDKKIKETFIDPRGEEIIIYEKNHEILRICPDCCGDSLLVDIV